MKRTNFTYLLTITLSIITLAIVGIEQSNNVLRLSDFPELVMYGLLTAFALYFSVQIQNGELSMAHVVGMMAFLAYPATASELILLVIFVGGLSGGFLMALRSFLQPPSQRRVYANLNTLIYVTARVTVSYFVATTFYLQTEAPLPLNNAESIGQLPDTLIALLWFAIVYIGIYTAIFALQIYAEDYPVVDTFRDNLPVIVVILLATVPFAILAALSPPASESIVSFAIVVAGTMFSTFGLHAISRVTGRLQRQLDEMRSLSRISQALSGNLNVQSLHQALYQQIKPLMNISNFKIVSYNDDTKEIHYDYVIHNSQPQTITDKSEDHDLIQRVILQRKSILLQDHVQDGAMIHSLLAPASLTSWLGVPMLSGNTVVGGLIVSSYENDRHFTPQDEHLLTIIAGTAGIAIENARLYEQKSLRAEQLTTLNKVATLLSGTLSPNEVIDIIISSASTITDAHAVALYLTNAGTKNRLKFVKGAGVSEHFINHPPQPELADRYLNSSEGYMTYFPVIVDNINKIGQNVALHATMVAEKKQAWVELPLNLMNNNFGVLTIFYDEPQNFTTEQIGLMEAFATQAAQAINNAQTYAVTDEALEVRIEQLYALAAMGRMLSATMDSQKICEVVLSYASDATQSDRGFVVLMNSDHSAIEFSALREYDPSVVTAESLTQGLNQHVFDNKQALRSDDIRLETGYLPLVPNTRSVLLVPFVRMKECFGLIRLESDDTRAFNDGDVHFVSQIANQAIIAMDNANLFQRIRNARDSLQTILDGMEDGIIMINPQRTVTIANPPVTMLGLNPDDLIQQSLDDLLKDRSLGLLKRIGFPSKQALLQVIDHLDNSTQWRNQFTHEYNIANDDGTRTYIKRLLIPVSDADDQNQSGILMVFYDKTEEHQLASARDALSQMIVHDLRSPLTAVTTSLTLLKTISSEDSKVKTIIEKTTSASQQAIQKVLSRINSLLDVSKMESGEIELHTEPAELATIVDNVIIELSPLAHDMNINITNDVSEDLPLLDIDSDKIERVLQNLVDNALKYSPKDSQVMIRAKQVGEADSEIQIDIVDSGPGIPDEYKRSIFNRFTQIEGRNTLRGGVGLGLTFCRMVTEGHGGNIWIADNPDGGSIFSLTLPTMADTRVENL